MVLRCNDCIFYHIDRSIQEGATKEELMETFNVALIVGGSIVIPHLRYAFEVMDNIFDEKESSEKWLLYLKILWQLILKNEY